MYTQIERGTDQLEDPCLFLSVYTGIAFPHYSPARLSITT